MRLHRQAPYWQANSKAVERIFGPSATQTGGGSVRSAWLDMGIGGAGRSAIWCVSDQEGRFLTNRVLTDKVGEAGHLAMVGSIAIRSCL